MHQSLHPCVHAPTGASMLEFSPPAVSTSASMLSFFNMDPQQTAPFMLGSPPLAALHSMTEMKQAMMQYNRQSNGAVAGAAAGQAAGGAATPTSSGAGSPVSSVIPHGIDSILNRPSPGQLAFGSQLTSQINSQLGSQLGSRLGQSGVYLNSQLGKSQLGEFGRPSPLAWPGLQGMIQNPVFWRERFSGQLPGVNLYITAETVLSVWLISWFFPVWVTGKVL